LVYAREDQRDWGFAGSVTRDGRYLLIHVWVGTNRENGLFFAELQKPDWEVVPLLDQFDAAYQVIGSEGEMLFILTDENAPNQRLVAVDLSNPFPNRWRVLIPEQEQALEQVTFVGGKFVGRYLQDAHSRVQLYDRGGDPDGEIALPGLGTVTGFQGSQDDPETFFHFTSFTKPGGIYRCDLDQGTTELFRTPELNFDPERYATDQIFYKSSDGTQVPMFITYKQGIAPSLESLVYLYGYGGFNISMTPEFSVSILVLLELGGIFVQPNLRGGGEYGRAWHEGGMKLQKQNVFDDFIAAAEWLIDNGYTSPGRLAIGGGSNGGLLVAACAVQRPDLFAVCLPNVGVLDMLRFHKFTIGWGWTSDYGSPEDPEEFQALLAYSPYHNLEAGTAYPATLVTTADHDDRVYPAHSFKFAAALQAAHEGESPVLIRVETKAGHGLGKPTAKIIEQTADRWAFLLRNVGLA
jgi:prolyl oligopeptidase